MSDQSRYIYGLLIIFILTLSVFCNSNAAGNQSSSSNVQKTIAKIHMEDFVILIANNKGYFTSGKNQSYIRIQKSGANIHVDSLQLLIYMPAMPPTMPYMEAIIQELEEISTGLYQTKFELDMGDTWQVKISFRADGKEHTASSQFNAKS